MCASLYSASEVTAKVGGGTNVTISEETDYPFRDTIQFKMALPEASTFPLYLRIPGWCEAASVLINGAAQNVEAKPLAFVRIKREWKNGDEVTLRLPMKITVRRWTDNHNAASVNYGPLSFSLEIKEQFEKYGDRKPAWPEWEVFPKSAWNYGLILDDQNPAASFQLVEKPGAIAPQPFTPETAPVELKAKGRRIPAWQMDRNNMIGKLQASPVRSTEPVEDLTLIPMGAARLRVAMFPVIGDGPDANDWVAPAQPKPAGYQASASHCFSGDSVEALDDGLEPASSNDHDIPRFTWWDHRGTKEWVQYDFKQPKEVSSVSVYWFDDTGNGQCRIPASWQLLYRDGDDWKPVPQTNVSSAKKDDWNTLSFPTIQTPSLTN